MNSLRGLNKYGWKKVIVTGEDIRNLRRGLENMTEESLKRLDAAKRECYKLANEKYLD
jgi:hypothetical protein